MGRLSHPLEKVLNIVDVDLRFEELINGEFKLLNRSDRLSNLITLCTRCHTADNHKPDGCLFGWQPKSKSFKKTTFISMVRWKMVNQLQCQHTYGHITKSRRISAGLEKNSSSKAYAQAEFTLNAFKNNGKKMKKSLFNLILATVLSLGLAGTTYAFSFSFHGKMWQTVGSTDNNATLPHSQKSGKTDFFSYNNALNAKGMKSSMYSVMSENESTTFGLSKARLRFEGKTDDGFAKIVYGLEVGTYTWGDTSNGFGLSGDGTNEETRFVYAEVAMPVIGGKVRAGLQPTKINPWVWTETAPGLTYHTNIKGWKTMVGWYRGEDDNITNGGDNDYFVLKTNNKLNKNFNLGFFSILTNLDENTTSASDAYDADYYYLGVNGKFNKGNLFGNCDAIYQGGEIDFENASIEDLDRSAWLGDLTLGYKVTDKFKLSVNFLYVSGDDDSNDGDAENFDSIDVDVKIGTIFFKDTILADCDRTISDAPYFMDKGLINYAVQGEYQINKKNNFRAAVRYLTTAEDLELKPNEADNDLGYEFDLWYTYKLNKHVDLRIDAAYLVAGDGADHLAASDDYESSNIYKIASGIKIQF